MRRAEKLPVVKDGMRVMYIRDCAVEQKELQLSSDRWDSALTQPEDPQPATALPLPTRGSSQPRCLYLFSQLQLKTQIFSPEMLGRFKG